MNKLGNHSCKTFIWKVYPYVRRKSVILFTDKRRLATDVPAKELSPETLIHAKVVNMYTTTREMEVRLVKTMENLRRFLHFKKASF